MSRSFNEDTRVKFPATIQFMRLGYEYVSCEKAQENEDIDFNTKIVKSRFKKAIEKLNNIILTDDDLYDLLRDIHVSISNNDKGKDFYNWLVYPNDRKKLIDFENIDNNDFAVMNELPFSIKENTEEGSFRPDINILINGMPLSFLEVKRPMNDGGIRVEFERNEERMRNDKFKKHFNMFQLVSFSNNMKYPTIDEMDENKVNNQGSFYTTPNGDLTTYNLFREDVKDYIKNYPYLDINRDTQINVLKDNKYNPFDIIDTPEYDYNIAVDTPCNSFVTSLYDKKRFMFFIRYGITYVQGIVTEKHIMRYPQFFASFAVLNRLNEGGKRGIIWHTQGSGKTALAAYLTRILRDYYGKKQINTRFFFVVDRLELLRQTQVEFTNRGLNVITCSNREEFEKELNRTTSLNTNLNTNGEIVVVNIQKFTDNYPVANNPYNLKTQKIFFVDECHRSYSSNGVFFKNLMLCDNDAVFLALTGTPLLTDKERSDLKFGDYIHTYFFDKSIQDGYTLRIKKEPIATKVKVNIKRNFVLKDKSLDTKDVYESDVYVNDISSYIVEDFKDFRLQYDDNSVGGFIVCRSNTQAKKIYNWIKDNSDLSVGLVISDSGNSKQSWINRDNQKRFRENDKSPLDILVVEYMLTTGFDAKRLKRLYLLRGPKAHSLLQTITRVNRPYTPTNGTAYHFGYIVDFYNIDKEMTETLKDYMKELNSEEDGLQGESFNGLIDDAETIYNKYLKLLAELKGLIKIDNIEILKDQYSKFLKNVADLEKAAKIRILVENLLDCHRELLSSQSSDKNYAKNIDIKKLRDIKIEIDRCINARNLQDRTRDSLTTLSNDKVIELVYEFVSGDSQLINLSEMLKKLEEERKNTDGKSEDKKNTTKSDKDTTTVRILLLVEKIKAELEKAKSMSSQQKQYFDDRLKQIFTYMGISYSDTEKEQVANDLEITKNELVSVNEENNKKAEMFDGHGAFIDSWNEIKENFKDLDSVDIEKLLKVVYTIKANDIGTDNIKKGGKRSFVDSLKSSVTTTLLNNKEMPLFAKINKYSEDIYSIIYKNLVME